jgi:hypothetical protein
MEAAKIKASKGADRGETTGLMEPLVLAQGSAHRTALQDLAIELATRSAAPAQPVGMLRPPPVRSMNCYYSNLIEGHDTHPSISSARSRKTTAPTESGTCSRGGGAHIAAENDQ